jgi:hypothetical protein
MKRDHKEIEMKSKNDELKNQQIGEWGLLEATQNSFTLENFDSSMEYMIKRVIAKNVGIKHTKIVTLDTFFYPHFLASSKLIPLLSPISVKKEGQKETKYVFQAATQTTNRAETFHVASKDILNTLFYNIFNDIEFGDSYGNINSDPTLGPLKGGKITFRIDSSALATVSYNWREQACQLKFFIEKYHYVLDVDGKLKLEELLV